MVGCEILVVGEGWKLQSYGIVKESGLGMIPTFSPVYRDLFHCWTSNGSAYVMGLLGESEDTTTLFPRSLLDLRKHHHGSSEVKRVKDGLIAN